MFEADRRVYEFGPFRLDVQERLLFREGQPVPLTDKVFDLLVLLVENAGRALGKAELMDRLWPDAVVEENNLTVNMSLLRKALGEGPSDRRYIETLPRRGYRFVARVSSLDARSTTSPVVVAEPASGAMAPEGAPRRVFVGRERELARLERALDGALAGRGSVVFVSGPAGMGKTELCEQLRARRGDMVIVAVGHCFEHHGAKEAYSPFLELVGGLLAGPHAGVVRAVLERYAPTWHVQFAGALGDGEAAAAARGADGGRMVREMVALLEALAAVKPLLVLLEDLHWADPSSLDVLGLLAHRVGSWRALVVGTLRAEQVELENPSLKNLRRELLARERCEEIALPLLEPGAIASYLDARFEAHDLPRDFGELIHRTTEGQPLFATRLVQLLVERGDLVEASGRWTLTRPIAELELGVPSTVRGVIERRFESVDERSRRALQYASVIGVEFGSAVLAALLGEDEIDLDERLNELARRHRLLVPAGEEQLSGGRASTRYRFAHALYQSVLYESLAAQRRMALHAQIAERLLEQSAGTKPRAAAQIAAHLERARDFRRAIDLWIEAADQSSRLYADVQAADQYRHALTLIDRLEPRDRVPLRIILLYNHAWCRAKIGEHDTGLRDFEAMLRCASEPEFTGPGDEPERARAVVFDFFEQPWRDAFGVYDMARMPNQDRSLGPSAIQCEAYWGMCYTLLEANRLDELGVRAKEYLELAEATRNEPRQAEALAWMAGRELELANFGRAVQLAGESTRIARTNGHHRTLSMSLFFLATAEQRAADYESAESRLEQSLALNFEAQSRVWALLELVRVRTHRGDVPGARAALEEARDISERKARDDWMVYVVGVSGELQRELGELDAAFAHFDRGLEIASRLGSPPVELEALVSLGHVQAARGELEHARALFERADRLERAASSGTGSPFASPLQRHDFALANAWARAELGLAAGDLETAEHHAGALLELATAAAALRHIAIAHHVLARAALARRRRSRASEHVEAGLRALGERTVPFVRARLAATARQIG